MNPIVIRAHQAVLVSHGMLLALVLGWQFSARPAPAGVIVALLAALPLVLPWAGLLRGIRRTHAWATLCVAPYLVLGVVESVANPADRVWSGSCLLLALLFFTTLIIYLRLTRPAPSP